MTSSIQMIPLNKLVVSPRNVRKTDRKADIAALAASIASRGLLQNLCVVETEAGTFEVDAGGRRLAALKQLARAGTIPKDHAVACNVVSRDEGLEVSLMENVHRIGMDAMDEVEAYGTLVEGGATPDDVARRFGVTRRHVDQRLALSGLSPKIKKAWKRGDISLDAARAFCLVHDHAKQDTVFKTLGKPITHAASVRARLMEGRVTSSDRLVTFVGLEAYESAGGVVTRDLFDADAVFVADPALIAQLAEEKLSQGRQAFLDDGWGWVDIQLESNRPDGYAPTRVQQVLRTATSEEESELQRLESEIAALDDALDQDSVEDDPRWEMRDTLEGQLEALRQTLHVWPAEMINHAGVVLSIDHAGRERISYGLVRSSDERKVRALMQARSTSEASEDAEPDVAEADESDPSDIDLPKAVIRDLSLARTRAIRSALVQRPDIALALVVAAMVLRAEHRFDLQGVGIGAQSARIDDEDACAAHISDRLSRLPVEEGAIVGWCLGKPAHELLEILASISAMTIDLSHEKGLPLHAARRKLADMLASELHVDMRDHWRPDAGYWARLSKAQLLAAIATAPRIVEMRERKRADVMKTYAKLKRDVLAAKAAEVFDGFAYLPDLLITPLAQGALEVTDAGYASIAAE